MEQICPLLHGALALVVEHVMTVTQEITLNNIMHNLILFELSSTNQQSRILQKENSSFPPYVPWCQSVTYYEEVYLPELGVHKPF